MATKKFSTFEYAALADAGKSGFAGLIRYDVFETPYGYACVLIVNEEETKHQAELSGIAMERISYFLKNAPDEKTELVTQSALIYLSGYMHRYGKKNPEYKSGKMSCMCVLLHNESVYYSWYGNVEILLFADKRLYLLGGHQSDPEKSTKSKEQSDESANYIGHQAVITPFAPDNALKPVSYDKLIITSGNTSQLLNTKEIKRILNDTMPLQTKAARILKSLENYSENNAIALSLIRFYAFQNIERKLPFCRPVSKHEAVKEKDDAPQKKPEIAHREKSKLTMMILSILYGLGLIIVGFFFFDLFIRDEHPAISLPDTLRTVDWNTVHVVSDTLEVADRDTTPVVPEDVTYTVRGGDTWGRIYTQFGVCSWFIINHSPNTGRFGREGSLLAGQRLRIPVKYSGKPELNPYYYREFTNEIVGDRCENANKELRQAFEDRIKQ